MYNVTVVVTIINSDSCLAVGRLQELFGFNVHICWLHPKSALSQASASAAALGSPCVSTTMLKYRWTGPTLSDTAERNTPTWRPSRAWMTSGCWMASPSRGSGYATTRNPGSTAWAATPTRGGGQRPGKRAEPVSRDGRQMNRPALRKMNCASRCCPMENGTTTAVNQFLSRPSVTPVRRSSSGILHTECICS